MLVNFINSSDILHVPYDGEEVDLDEGIAKYISLCWERDRPDVVYKLSEIREFEGRIEYVLVKIQRNCMYIIVDFEKPLSLKTRKIIPPHLVPWVERVIESR